jgi:tetratricopeptide (TPR) repeat protein
VAFTTIATAMTLQNAGHVDEATAAYTQAVKELDPLVAAHLDPAMTKAVRDRMAYSLVQIAVLQRGKADSEPYLRYSYNIEKPYLGFEVVRADELFAEGKYADAFAIYQIFTNRAGDDQRPGMPRLIAQAMKAAASSNYEEARTDLRAAFKEKSEFGYAPVLFLLGEVDRARHDATEARMAFWEALTDPHVELNRAGAWGGLYGAQICAAGALAKF